MGRTRKVHLFKERLRQEGTNMIYITYPCRPKLTKGPHTISYSKDIEGVTCGVCRRLHAEQIST